MARTLTAVMLLGTAGAALAPPRQGGKAMVCGDGVAACGVLALMTGLGSGVQNVTGGAIYGHPAPVLHGLWPETPPYGTSKCLPPGSPDPPATVYPCYACGRADTNCSDTVGHSPSQFQAHEFGKHGICAGVASADDYFTQLCAISAKPLAALRAARTGGVTSLSGFSAAVEASDEAVEVFGTNQATMELYLSACRDEAAGKWVLAPAKSFPARCGGHGR